MGEVTPRSRKVLKVGGKEIRRTSAAVTGCDRPQSPRTDPQNLRHAQLRRFARSFPPLPYTSVFVDHAPRGLIRVLIESWCLSHIRPIKYVVHFPYRQPVVHGAGTGTSYTRTWNYLGHLTRSHGIDDFEVDYFPFQDQTGFHHLFFRCGCRSRHRRSRNQARASWLQPRFKLQTAIIFARKLWDGWNIVQGTKPSNVRFRIDRSPRTHLSAISGSRASAVLEMCC